MVPSVTAAPSNAAAERRATGEEAQAEGGAAAAPPLAPPPPARERERGFRHLACTYRAPLVPLVPLVPLSPSTATTACEPVAGSSQTPVAAGEDEDDELRADAGTSSTSTGGPPDATSYRRRYAREVTTTTASAEAATAVTAPRPLCGKERGKGKEREGREKRERESRLSGGLRREALKKRTKKRSLSDFCFVLNHAPGYFPLDEVEREHILLLLLLSPRRGRACGPSDEHAVGLVVAAEIDPTVAKLVVKVFIVVEEEVVAACSTTVRVQAGRRRRRRLLSGPLVEETGHALTRVFVSLLAKVRKKEKRKREKVGLPKHNLESRWAKEEAKKKKTALLLPQHRRRRPSLPAPAAASPPSSSAPSVSSLASRNIPRASARRTASR